MDTDGTNTCAVKRAQRKTSLLWYDIYNDVKTWYIEEVIQMKYYKWNIYR